MKETKKLTKKTFRKLKEVETLYKIIHRYQLQDEAHKKLLEIYIQTKKKSS